MDDLTKPTFAQALRFWLKLGFISFGGPAGQIAIMHTEVVEKRRWISEASFLHALNFCMLLPGPEAQQLATYLGWRLHGVKGGIAAGALFVLPAAVLLWALSWLYMAFGSVGWVSAVFQGLQPAVLAIVLAAVLRVGKKALKNAAYWGIAAAAFVALFWFQVHFAIVVLGAGLIGWLGSRWLPERFGGRVPARIEADTDSASLLPQGGRPKSMAVLRLAGACLMAWWLPILLIGILLGWNSVWFQQGLFFSKTALITFGGAYAVLPYVGQQAVEHHGWLSASQMMTGLALAETTPGPLIMVLQFVGFVGAWQHPAGWPALLAGTLGAAVTTWATFLPSFLFIFTAAPYLTALEKCRPLSAALQAITAAVVGVISNLAVWFAVHALVTPQGVDWLACAFALGLFLAMQRWKVDVLWIVLAGVAFGLGRYWLS